MTMELPENLQSAISKILKNEYKMVLQDSRRMADAVLALSDFYTHEPNHATPWAEEWCQIAYLVYFFPLNYLRQQQVFARANQVGFWQNPTWRQVMDFGSGLGSGSLNIPGASFVHVERSVTAREWHEQILQDLGDRNQHLWYIETPKIDLPTLGLFSYSLAEVEALPDWAQDCQALCITEPSTRVQGRKLLEIRKDLIAKGWYIWGPCTHQQACPLLTHSPTDWCHDRLHVAMPDWFLQMEQHLPMRNRTLTSSYLLARRDPPTMDQSAMARLTGDHLNEKGKSRQLVCHSDKREFLAWMHREGEPQVLPRGDLIYWPTEFSEKSNELRLKQVLKTVD